MSKDLSRLLCPKSIAIIGGGAWCEAVGSQLEKASFGGNVWHVHPHRSGAFPSISELPEPPDAAFIGINREATIDAVACLSEIGAGGAVCFASGFAEVDDGEKLNDALIKAAGQMPILGPNCYGFINNFDGALLWPDQHGGVPVQQGVAILTQSSNIAINLTMQMRGLPIGYVVTCGNQTQTTQAQIALSLLDDHRVTAIGLHIEGFGDLDQWQVFAREAHRKGIPVVAIKVGRSTEAQSAAISHTASLAGSDAGADALLRRFGIARVDDLAVFIETLKILHVTGPLKGNKIATISCSGGEASLAADLAKNIGLVFPTLNERQFAELSATLGPKVALGNPLDYHTYIWRDADAMTATFSAMIDPQIDLTMLLLDFPRADRCDATDWDVAVQSALDAREKTGGPLAVVATLPELLPEGIAAKLIAGGVIPLNGLSEALLATQAACLLPSCDLEIDLCPRHLTLSAEAITEAEAKNALSEHGVQIPRSVECSDPNAANLVQLRFPVAVKGLGLAHKTEAGAVALNIMTPEAARLVAKSMPATNFLIEEMVDRPIVELIVGVTRDAAHGLILTIGAGGVLTELLQDNVSMLIPSSEAAIENALRSLKVSALISGYRGQPAADRQAIIAAILSIQNYALANHTKLQEVEVNPLICTPNSAIAVDALIRIAP